jgi:phosphate transport system permease protein
MSTAASLHQSRKRKNGVMMTLCVIAAGIGLAWLALILGALLYKGLAGISFSVFTEMTPPPGDAGGLLTAIYGRSVLPILGIIVGTPIGVRAGTDMAA